MYESDPAGCCELTASSSVLIKCSWKLPMSFGPGESGRGEKRTSSDFTPRERPVTGLVLKLSVSGQCQSICGCGSTAMSKDSAEHKHRYLSCPRPLIACAVPVFHLCSLTSPSLRAPSSHPPGCAGVQSSRLPVPLAATAAPRKIASQRPASSSPLLTPAQYIDGECSPLPPNGAPSPPFSKAV